MVERAVCVAAGNWASSCLCPQADGKSVGSDITQSRVVSLSLSPWIHEASPVVPVPWRCWEASRVCVVGDLVCKKGTCLCILPPWLFIHPFTIGPAAVMCQGLGYAGGQASGASDPGGKMDDKPNLV